MTKFIKDLNHYYFVESDKLGPIRINASKYSQLVGWWDVKKLKPQATGIFLDHLKNDFRPKIPFGVLALALWSEIFNDLDVINELRPLLYVYWG